MKVPIILTIIVTLFTTVLIRDIYSDTIVIPCKERQLQLINISSSELPSEPTSVPTLAWPLFGARLGKSKALWCGGSSYFGQDSTEYHKYCFKFDLAENKWSHFGNLALGRSNAALVRMGEHGHLWALGGVRGNEVLRTSEIMRVTENDVYVDVKEGPKLPQRLGLPCAAGMTNTTVFVAGTYTGRQYAFVFDQIDASFYRLDVSRKRAGAVCGLINGPEDEKQVVLAGGFEGSVSGNRASAIVEMYDINTDTLFESEAMPFGLINAAVVFRDTKLYLVGGRTNDDTNGIVDYLGVLQFDNEQGWIELDVLLEEPLSAQDAVLLHH